jgi:hypothetical protein
MLPDMSSALTDLAARGRVLRMHQDRAVFQPAGTSYEHHVLPQNPPQTDRPVSALICVKARKVYGVPSGGAFVQPILGEPRILQGRVLSIDAKTLTLRAGGGVFVAELPAGKDTIDLHQGPIEVGDMVNVVALPGAEIRFVD